MVVTFYAKELVDAYVDLQAKANELSGEETWEYRKSVYENYRLKDTLCFGVEMQNFSQGFQYLGFTPVSSKIILSDNRGREFHPVSYDEGLEGPL